MRTPTHRSLSSGVTTVTIVGELRRSTRTTISTAIEKAAAECPSAVFVDLSALRRPGPVPLSLFAAAAYQAQESWGVPVLFYGADPEIRAEMSAFRSFVAVYDDRMQAGAALQAYHPRWLQERLAAAPSSAAAARALVGEACLTWRLPHLWDNARLVVSELAANAIRHVGTDFTVTAGYTRNHLRIAVQDGSHAMPHAATEPLKMAGPPAVAGPLPGSGRGLRLVEALSVQWGAIRVPTGKIVWALLGTAESGPPG